MQQNNPQPEQAAGGVQDTSGGGGGQIGMGTAPVPGEQGFTGNEQAGNAETGGQPPQTPMQ